MNWSKNTSFADRLSAAAEAKKAQLERAAQARAAAESPAAVERRMARDVVKVARDARIAERRATKLGEVLISGVLKIDRDVDIRHAETAGTCRLVRQSLLMGVKPRG